MNRPTIGWYIHHHGHGHLTRFLAIRPFLDADVVCFSSLEPPTALPAHTLWIRLERDDQIEEDREGFARNPVDADPTASGLLHWAPLAHGGHRSRLGRIAQETLRQNLDAFVVDVSAEVTLFVRLLGVPVVLVAQPGQRTDDTHRTAYRAAARILAPWPAGLGHQPAFDPSLDVVYTGGISRFADRAVVSPKDRTGILVLLGSGGGDVTPTRLAELHKATPSVPVTALGPGHAWTPDPWEAISASTVVITWAGQNSVADLAAANARAVVIPQERPFEEQFETAAALQRHGLAVVERSWPTARDWPEVLERATTLNPAWDLWRAAGAAQRASAAIMEVARRWFR